MTVQNIEVVDVFSDNKYVVAYMGNFVALVVMYINEKLNCIIASQIVTAHHMGRSV